MPIPFKRCGLALLAGVGLVSPALSAVSEIKPEAADAVPEQRAALDTFRYGHFAVRAWQLGLPRQWLGFTVKIGTDGRIVDCSFDRKFRSAFTPKDLCDRLRESMTFHPARDAGGNPVSDVYSNKVQVASRLTFNR